VAWFPVHCTSINNTNKLISGDNKGVAAQLLEKWATSAKGNVSQGEFVGAFGQANVGDTSPNTQGAFCLDTGDPRLSHRTSLPYAQTTWQVAHALPPSPLHPLPRLPAL